MIIGGAYQPVLTRTLDDLAELEAEARALFDAHRLVRYNAGPLSADDLTRLTMLIDALDRLSLHVWSLLVLPDWAATWRALISANNILRLYAKQLHELEAKADTNHREASTG